MKRNTKRKTGKPEREEIFEVKACRICKNNDLLEFFSLGAMPPPNLFPKSDDNLENEPFYPLDVYFCQHCGLVQLKHVVNPNIMFRDYIYITSGSNTMVEHFGRLAEELVKKFKLNSDSLVVDIGSNDGTLLSHFKRLGPRTLGIDPAENLVSVAAEKGIEQLPLLFTNQSAKKVRQKYGRAKVITATNVFAHVNDLHDFVRGLKTLLTNDGIFIAEFPYLVDLLEKEELDTIYHEHLSYFAIRPLLTLFEKHDLKLFDVKRLPVHGGSIRLYVRRGGKKTLTPVVKELLRLEERMGMETSKPYLDFAKKAYDKRRNLVKFLSDLKAKGKQIIGYGAAAKGNILLNFCNIGPEILDYIVDAIPDKQGRITPGVHIPVYPEAKLLEDMPDYALLLAWNFADEILEKNKEYRKKGGKFILVVPEIKIV